MTDREAVIHFVGGAVGGTAGTALTCPLEVVKTRMQSTRGVAHGEAGRPSTSSGGSNNTKSTPLSSSSTSSGTAARSSPYKHILANTTLQQMATPRPVCTTTTSFAFFRSVAGQQQNQNEQQQRRLLRWTVLKHFTNIVKNEGFAALYKGLVPNLIGVAPAKAVYFYTYSSSKRFWNETDYFLPNSALIHMLSAASAGFVSASAVNPIWLVKTRLQLNQGTHMSISAMVRRVYQREGIKGFYRGVTASYAGISETVIQFVLYEHLRRLLLSASGGSDEDRRKMDFLNFMVAGGTAKFVACVAAYPHEVVRTRLREEGSNNRGFFRTLYQLYKEGGHAMYRGLSVQLMRTVPNTAITMGTYELVVYLLHQV